METKYATGSGKGGRAPGGGALVGRPTGCIAAGGGRISTGGSGAVAGRPEPGATSTSMSLGATGGGGGPETGTGGGRRSSEGLKVCHWLKSGRGYLSTSTGSSSGRLVASLLFFCVGGGAAVATAAVAVGTTTTLSEPTRSRVGKISLPAPKQIIRHTDLVLLILDP